MKLYFAPRTAAIRARWLLEELGEPYELVKLDPTQQETRTPQYLALNPLGELPTLVDGDLTLFGSAAICLYLADRFPEKHLAPPPGSRERGRYYQWMFFAEGTLEPVLHAVSADDKAQTRLKQLLDVVAAALDGRELLAGDQFNAADLVMASLLHLAYARKLLDDHPRLVEYVARLTQRPAVRKAVSA